MIIHRELNLCTHGAHTHTHGKRDVLHWNCCFCLNLFMFIDELILIEFTRDVHFVCLDFPSAFLNEVLLLLLLSFISLSLSLFLTLFDLVSFHENGQECVCLLFSHIPVQMQKRERISLIKWENNVNIYTLLYISSASLAFHSLEHTSCFAVAAV